MAINATELTEALAAARISGSHCQDAADLARQMEAFSSVVENIFQQFMTEITNIINNGGGGATTPVYIIRALVNQVGGVPASQVEFNFDGATDLYTLNGEPSGVTSGVARNIEGRVFQDNEPVKLVSFNGTTWLADKIGDNIIYALVNEPGDVLTTDLTFDFDGAVAIGPGLAPAGGIGVAVNITRNAYANNERVVLQLVENPQVLTDAGLPANSIAWAVLQDDDDLGGSGGAPGEDLIGDWGIDEELLASQGKIAVDRRSGTLYTSGQDMLFGNSRTNNKSRFFRMDIVVIDIEDP